MNRFISLLLTCTMLLSFCACGNSNHDTDHVQDEVLTPIVDTVLPPTDSNEPDILPTPPASDTTEDNASSEEPVQEETPEEYVRTVDPYGKMVALTFDDGPHQTYSDLILDILEEYHSVATFFEVGKNARAYPDVLRRMTELGCEVASHSNAHHDLSTLSRNALLTDLGYADNAIQNATGIAPSLVRPPYGAVNKLVKNETGRAMIAWTVDTEDWRLRDSQKLIEYFQSLTDLDGEVVLLHSIHASTAEAMKTVIPWLIEQGYQLVTVSELMAYYYGVLLEPNVYYDQTWFLRHGRTEYPLELPSEPMQTLIPEYTVVPVVPISTKPADTPQTPPETPAVPPQTPPEEPETPETPQETPETLPEVPPQEPELPKDPELPPEVPSETPETPSENGDEQTPTGDPPSDDSTTTPPETETPSESESGEASGETPPSTPESDPELPPSAEDIPVPPPLSDGDLPST